MQQPIDIEMLCAQRGLRITEQRRIIARVLSDSLDHPDVDRLHERASAIDSGISIATVYRTVRLFEEAGILDRHDFGDGRARYEAAPEAHHAVRGAIVEALRCKAEGKAETILFNLCGHGHFDMQAYSDYFSGKLQDLNYDESELAMALAGLPSVPA